MMINRKQVILPNFLVKSAEPSASKMLNRRLQDPKPLNKSGLSRNFLNILSNFIEKEPALYKEIINPEWLEKLAQGSGVYQWVVDADKLEEFLALHDCEDAGDMAYWALREEV